MYGLLRTISQLTSSRWTSIAHSHLAIMPANKHSKVCPLVAKVGITSHHVMSPYSISTPTLALKKNSQLYPLCLEPKCSWPECSLLTEEEDYLPHLLSNSSRISIFRRGNFHYLFPGIHTW